jgi:flagellar protein FliO/FliZ
LDLATLLTTAVALAAVLGLIVLAGRIARLGGFASHAPPAGPLIVTQALALDTRRRLHLVRCGDHQVLLLTGGAQDLVVGWLPGQSTQHGPIEATAMSGTGVRSGVSGAATARPAPNAGPDP